MMAIDLPAVASATVTPVHLPSGGISVAVPTQTSSNGSVASPHGSNTGNTASTIPTTTAIAQASMLYRNRTVARPVANLGNTCYINAVLQALAHAPELCLAMDCDPHSAICPIAAANRIKLPRSGRNENDNGPQRGSLSRCNSFPHPSPSSSPEGTSITANLGVDVNAPTTSTNSTVNCTVAPSGGRKTRRGGRRSPRLGDADGGTTGGVVSSGALNVDVQSGSTGRGMYSDGKIQFCALCEVEKHIRRVHDENTAPSSLQRERPIAPDAFVHGFFHSVAPPWFKLGIQEDSHEFLRLLIDAMQKSCRKARPLPTSLTDDKVQLAEDKIFPNCSVVKEAIETGVSIDAPAAAEAFPEPADANSCTVSKNMNNDTEYPFTLFRGMVESKVVCNHCGATSSTLDPIEDIGLEVTSFDHNQGNSRASSSAATGSGTGRSSRSSTNVATADVQSSSGSSLLDVQTAFQRYASEEDLDSGYKCEKCQKVGRATKQSRLASIPPILTLHLKRFRYGGADSRTSGSGSVANSGSGQSNTGNTLPTRTTRSSRSSEVSQLMGASDYYGVGKSGSAKIDGHVKFDPVFDLSPYVTEELQTLHPSLYCRLFAVIVHAGKNSHSGHYIAYVQNVTKHEWYKMDDSRVTPAALQEVLNAEAYMLFYRVVRHPVSVHLEDTFRKRLDEDAVQRQESSASSATVTLAHEKTTKEPVSENPKTIGSLKNNKKRSQSEVIDECSKPAEEWFRTKTNIPPNLIGIIRKMQDAMANKMQLTAVGREKLLNDSDGPSSPRSTIIDDCIDGGYDIYRKKMVRVFHELVLKNKETETNGTNAMKAAVDSISDWFSLRPTEDTKTDIRDSHEKSINPEGTSYTHASENIGVSTNIDLKKKTRILSRVVLEEPDDAVGLL